MADQIGLVVVVVVVEVEGLYQPSVSKIRVLVPNTPSMAQHSVPGCHWRQSLEVEQHT